MLNFIDKAAKESDAKTAKFRAEVQSKMKELFIANTTGMKADKATLKLYFKLLSE